jgi:hypothetical protein
MQARQLQQQQLRHGFTLLWCICNLLCTLSSVTQTLYKCIVWQATTPARSALDA